MSAGTSAWSVSSSPERKPRALHRRGGDAGAVGVDADGVSGTGGSRPPWLWLYGPAGVGKSAIGYEIYRRLVGRGRRIGYVEVDQIGMCMPAEPEDRSRTKADNLLALLETFAQADMEGVVVSGDMAGPAMHHALEHGATQPVLCRLRADHDVIVERLTVRGSPQFAEASRTYDDDHTVPAGDLRVTTHPLGVSELADQILGELGSWPPSRPQLGATPGDATDSGPPTATGCDALLVTGPRAVGKSTVAWQVFMRSVSAGIRTAYLDLEQLAFLQPALAPDNLAVKLANVAACWRGFARQGAVRLMLCGNVETASDVDRYRTMLPSLHVVALTAGHDAILRRARQRRLRKEIWLPGDDLFGRPESELLSTVERSMASFASTGSAVERADERPPTDDLTAAEVACQITPWSESK